MQDTLHGGSRIQGAGLGADPRRAARAVPRPRAAAPGVLGAALPDVEAEANVTFSTVSFGRVVSGIRMKDTYDISAHHCISAHHYDDMI